MVRVGVTTPAEMGLGGDESFLGLRDSLLVRCWPLGMGFPVWVGWGVFGDGAGAQRGLDHLHAAVHVTLEGGDGVLGDLRQQQGGSGHLGMHLKSLHQFGPGLKGQGIGERAEQGVQGQDAALEVTDFFSGFLKVFKRTFKKKPQPKPRFFVQARSRRGSDHANVRSLQALLALGHFKFDALVFCQGLEAVALDFAEVSEQVFSPLSCAMKPKPLPSLNHFTVPV